MSPPEVLPTMAEALKAKAAKNTISVTITFFMILFIILSYLISLPQRKSAQEPFRIHT
jgi:preprotein translocase subunit YajC